MSLSKIIAHLATSEPLRATKAELLGQGRTAVVVDDCGLACAIAAWHLNSKVPFLVLTTGSKAAWRLWNQLQLWTSANQCDNSVYWLPPPATTKIFASSRVESSISSKRVATLSALARSEPVVVVAPIEAALAKTISCAEFKDQMMILRVGNDCEPGRLLADLSDHGYDSQPQVEVPGAVCKRGGIVDIFAPGSQNPARVEFLGNTIESIRLFDPVTQRSLSRIESLWLPPATEYPMHKERSGYARQASDLDWSVNRDVYADWKSTLAGGQREIAPLFGGLLQKSSLASYLPPTTTIVVIRPQAIASSALAVETREKSALKKFGDLPPGFPMRMLTWSEFDSATAEYGRIEIEPWGLGQEMPGGIRKLPFQRLRVAEGDVDTALNTIRSKVMAGTRVTIVSIHTPRLEELTQGLDVGLVSGQLGEGFEIEIDMGLKLCVMTDRELFGITKEPVYHQVADRRSDIDLEVLKEGAYVVHIDHGIARFGGVKPVGDQDLEHLVLEYAEGDRLYVPVNQVGRVQIYLGPRQTSPRLSRLGSGGWKRSKVRARKATELLAGELFARDARRRVESASACIADTPWQTQMEAAFEFTETPDQLRSILEVKHDLELSRPMDRIVCGDVGYGKTEVALRAAFKAVNSGGQVALVSPTTLLANQHHATFSQRMRPFPVKIALLSSLVPKRLQKSVLAEIASGTTDIVVGTHRILQADVRFKKLTLAIVDEEHRFGVCHKEIVKQIHPGVNLLSMSATPIPRTLHMALSGVRDISIINTPPTHRQPVQTYVTSHSKGVVREALLSELARDGQAFVVHNRIKTIYAYANDIAELVPDARVAVIHARMNAIELESVMGDFTAGRYDVLVTTSIVESGLDLHNVNTLIVDRADRFGLSQLYQLRGRVGRGHMLGFAYFLVPPNVRLPHAATHRLRAILDATDLSSGLRLARDDLNIRGAGNILGAEQSGHMSAVGSELYTQMLREAVENLKCSPWRASPSLQHVVPTQVALAVESHLPNSYINGLAQRLAFYRRLAEVAKTPQVDDIEAELRDRFGVLPSSVASALTITRIRIKAQAVGVVSVSGDKEQVTLVFKEPLHALKTVLKDRFNGRLEIGYKRVRLQIESEKRFWAGAVESLLDGLNELSGEPIANNYGRVESRRTDL